MSISNLTMAMCTYACMDVCAIARSHDDNFVYAAGGGKIRPLRSRNAARILIECGSDQKPLFCCRSVSTRISLVISL